MQPGSQQEQHNNNAEEEAHGPDLAHRRRNDELHEHLHEKSSEMGKSRNPARLAAIFTKQHVNVLLQSCPKIYVKNPSQELTGAGEFCSFLDDGSETRNWGKLEILFR
jgi:hypothetical protein